MTILEKAKQLSNIIVVGDTHGKIKELGYNIRERYKITDSIICLAGDIGLGFNKPMYHLNEFKYFNEIAKKTNNVIFVVRGNHDDPEYFNGQCFEYSNVKLVPDYYFLETQIYDILFVGGGISIDRTYRTLGSTYWMNEFPVYREDKLKIIDKPDIVITHSAPTFCHPTDKIGLLEWSKLDKQLLEDCDKDRMVFTKIFDYLKNNNKQPKHWIYGHFHMSYNQLIDGTQFKVLNELEMFELNKRKDF
jgi:hypothetical protein